MRLIITILLFIFIFPSFPHPSKALDCAQLESPAIEVYDSAVVGTVINVKDDILQKGFTGPKEMGKFVLIEVEKSWKKEIPSQVIFEADFTWGFNFEKGKKYLIYLNEENGAYVNSPCSPVKIVNSNYDYKELPEEGLKSNEVVSLEYKMWFMLDKDLDNLFFLLLMVIPLIIIWRLKNKIKG